ncbi:ABC transporter ATP-binding protein [Pseudaminobacter arsenicus]|uniref:ABC transporter ATP-binding protein n=1 Tax=Borborobacter arsenicus TaxID=1851146 RepID=A0A432V0C4_9HYPH|nr:ABC transporter ATP-binding protein [Pseudaminobacter arsenicus]
MVVPTLSIKDLTVSFGKPGRELLAVNGVTYDVQPGETLGVVGESGSGKSVTLLAALGLLPSPPARISRGSVEFQGRDLARMDAKKVRQIRGKDVGFIFQEPLTSLNPVMTIGDQIAEAIVVHDQNIGWQKARARAVELMSLVGMPDPERLAKQYPHEFSGGMRQRIVIAIAIANNPKLLIADEPTTALDVTVQAQILDVIREAQEKTGAATILVSHDLGVIAQMASKIVVMYAGRVMEAGDAEDVLENPLHPYTAALIECAPTMESELKDIHPIPGQSPSLMEMPSGCPFHPRCRYRQDVCASRVPAYRAIGSDRHVACHFVEETAEGGRLVVPAAIDA